MRIGELARETGVPTKTIRYYEEIGVLPDAARAANGYRIYDRDAVERLRFIRDAQSTGLTLTEISSVLELREQGASTCEHVSGLLEHHLEELDRHITTLQATRTQLATLTERARRLDPADCTDPHRCQTIAVDRDQSTGLASHIHRTPRPHTH